MRRHRTPCLGRGLGRKEQETGTGGRGELTLPVAHHTAALAQPPRKKRPLGREHSTGGGRGAADGELRAASLPEAPGLKGSRARVPGGHAPARETGSGPGLPRVARTSGNVHLVFACHLPATGAFLFLSLSRSRFLCPPGGEARSGGLVHARRCTRAVGFGHSRRAIKTRPFFVRPRLPIPMRPAIADQGGEADGQQQGRTAFLKPGQEMDGRPFGADVMTTRHHGAMAGRIMLASLFAAIYHPLSIRRHPCTAVPRDFLLFLAFGKNSRGGSRALPAEVGAQASLVPPPLICMRATRGLGSFFCFGRARV